MPNADKLRVAVLFGGRSAEHEISLLSARFVLESLDRNRFEPVLVGIDKEGRWRIQEAALLLGASRDPRLQKLNAAMPGAILPPHPTGSGEAVLTIDGGAPLAVDVVFPVLHGPMGEDGCVQGLLELAGVPYVGAGVASSAVGMDKDLMKRLLRDAGLPLGPYRLVKRHAWERSPVRVREELASLATPLFTKPANMGSSVGVRKVEDRAHMDAAIEEALLYDDKVIVEEGIQGAREIEVAVLGGSRPQASIPGEIVVDHPDGFYSYDAKYVDQAGAVTTVPAALTAAQTAEVQRLALEVFDVLCCEGLARIDFFLSKGDRFWVNEINTMPGFTGISMFPKLWMASGLSPRELVSRLIDDALARAALRRSRRTTR
jgi:D-alanine-D-alanine ligase